MKKIVDDDDDDDDNPLQDINEIILKNMPDEVDIKFGDDDDDDDEDEEKIKTEIKRIKKKEKLYKTLWRLFTISNKSLMIINFITILFSIFNPKSNMPLTLSVFT